MTQGLLEIYEVEEDRQKWNMKLNKKGIKIQKSTLHKERDKGTKWKRNVPRIKVRQDITMD